MKHWTERIDIHSSDPPVRPVCLNGLFDAVSRSFHDEAPYTTRISG